MTEVFTSFEEGLADDVTSLSHQIEIESEDSPEGLDLVGVAEVQEVGDDDVSDSLDVDPSSGIIYGEELIVSSEDVPQSEEIVGSETLGSVYDSIPVPASSSPSRCLFHQHFTCNFSYKSVLTSFSPITVWICNL